MVDPRRITGGSPQSHPSNTNPGLGPNVPAPEARGEHAAPRLGACRAPRGCMRGEPDGSQPTTHTQQGASAHTGQRLQLHGGSVSSAGAWEGSAARFLSLAQQSSIAVLGLSGRRVQQPRPDVSTPARWPTQPAGTQASRVPREAVGVGEQPPLGTTSRMPVYAPLRPHWYASWKRLGWVSRPPESACLRGRLGRPRTPRPSSSVSTHLLHGRNQAQGVAPLPTGDTPCRAFQPGL